MCTIKLSVKSSIITTLRIVLKGMVMEVKKICRSCCKYYPLEDLEKKKYYYLCKHCKARKKPPTPIKDK